MPALPDTYGATLLPVRLATVANVTIGTGVTIPATIDGVAPVAGDRILLGGQTTGSQNGIYTVSAAGGATGNITRAADFANADQMVTGCRVAVREGNYNRESAWMLANDTAITVGTTTIMFTREHPPVWQRQGDAWVPTLQAWENIPRYGVPMSNLAAATFASGTLYAFGGLVIPANQTLRSVNFWAHAASTLLTQSWCELLDSTRTIVAVSPSTTSQWTIGTRAFTFSSAYTNTTGKDAIYYVAICVTATTTMPGLVGIASSATITGQGPIVAGSSNTGLTGPGTVGTQRNALTATANILYFSVV